MTFQLVSLPTGHVSLELTLADLATLRAEIVRRFGDFQVEQKASYANVEIAGEQFLFENEWDAPCLISTTDAGSAMLRELARAALTMPVEARLAG